MSWVQTVFGEARRQGLDDDTLLRAAGMAAEELQRERWPVDHITRLWRAAAHLSQDPSFGLKAGAQVGPASFNVVSFIVQSAPTLRQALTVVQKYQRLISDGGRIQLLAGPQSSWVVYHPRQGDLAFSPHQIEAVLAAVFSFARWLAPQGLQARGVCFSHAALGPLPFYRQVFRCPIDFEQAYNGILLDNAVLDLPLPQADAQLAHVHALHAETQLRALTAPAPTPVLLKQWLSSHWGPPVPTRAEAAAALGLSEKTLSRRLQAQGTTYADMVDDMRRELALQRVMQAQWPLKDIAEQLGYASLAPFYRAFDRWTGLTPIQYRTKHRDTTETSAS